MTENHGFALVVGGVLFIFGGLGWLADLRQRERDKAPCETFGNVSVQHLPARCVAYFQDAGAR